MLDMRACVGLLAMPTTTSSVWTLWGSGPICGTTLIFVGGERRSVIMLTRRRHNDDDPDEVIPDGGSVKVPMMVRDSARTGIDYCSNDFFLAAHRPGFRRAADPAVRDAAERAYQQMCR